MRRVWAELSARCRPRARSVGATILALLVATGARRAAADWIPYDKLPGADRAAQVQSRWRDGGARSLARDIRWDVAAGRLWFRQANAWKVMSLASGEVADAPEGAEPPPPPPPRPSDPPAPSRGRQRPCLLYSSDA
ncbi:MAG: hypothetical protein FGM37_10385, partial [Phycisphaerales bacterium]|nr:hypothetical protein [Phycisphaerales bacterium]